MSRWKSVVYLAIVTSKDLMVRRMMWLISGFFLVGYMVTIPRREMSQRLLLKSRRSWHFSIQDDLVKRLLPVEAGVSSSGVALEKRFIVLKLPAFDTAGRVCIEKGVILIKFTESFLPFLHETNIAELVKYFRIVLEPSWAGYALESILAWARPEYGRTIIFCPEVDDLRFIERLDGGLVPVDIGASDWVDERVFYPIDGEEKTYDSIYVANYNSIKRLHRYFKALSRISIAGYRGAIVCSSWGGGRAKILQLLDYYGLSEKLTVYEDLRQEEINALLNKSKVNMLLSYKEGANKSVFEGFFAGTPAIVLKNNIGLNKSHINSRTGHLIDDADLERELEWFHSHWKEFDAARWARENISPRVTAAKLNQTLRNIALKEGEAWSLDIVAKVNSPELNYYLASDPSVRSRMNTELLDVFGKGSKSIDMPQLRAFLDRWRSEFFSTESIGAGVVQ